MLERRLVPRRLAERVRSEHRFEHYGKRRCHRGREGSGKARADQNDRVDEWIKRPVEPAGPEVATLDAAALGRELTVRAWQEGDRMHPLGLSGTKSLQDLFTDRGVPRSLRHTLPVVVTGEAIAWVAGGAVSEDFKLTPATGEVAILTATLHE